MGLRHTHIIDHMLFCEHVAKVKLMGEMHEETRFYLVMEYSENGSLEDYIISQKKINQTFSTDVRHLCTN